METHPAETECREYNPSALLDALIKILALKNDAALCKVLQVDAPVISKIRSRRLDVGPAMLIRMHDVAGMPIKDLRSLMGDRRKMVRFSRRHRKDDLYIEDIPHTMPNS
jgi:hypothetical protein